VSRTLSESATSSLSRSHYDCNSSASDVFAEAPQLVLFTRLNETAGNMSVSMNGSVPLRSVLDAAGSRIYVTFLINPSYATLSATQASTSFGKISSITVVKNNVSLTIQIFSVDISTISVTKSMSYEATVRVQVQNLAEPCESSITLRFACDFGPLRPQSDLLKAAETVYQASTVASSLMGNPTTALSNTGAASIMSVAAFAFSSDMDPLEASISPFGGNWARKADWAVLSRHCRCRPRSRDRQCLRVERSCGDSSKAP
jgi:hypothetical protein